MNFKNISAFKLYFKEYWTFFLLPILIFIFYFSILNFGYVHFEDNNVIIHNSKMLQETSAFAKVLTSDVNFGNTSNAFRPLQNLTFWIDTQLFGFNPFGYHLTNLLLHIICSLMIMKYTFLISKKRSASFLIASVFAIHPFSMMTIAWIPGRGDLLLLLFGTMFLIGIQHLNHKSSHKNLLLIALSLFLALLSNETAYVLVPLAVLLTFIRKIKWEKNQFFKFSISFSSLSICSFFI